MDGVLKLYRTRMSVRADREREGVKYMKPLEKNSGHKGKEDEKGRNRMVSSPFIEIPKIAF